MQKPGRVCCISTTTNRKTSLPLPSGPRSTMIPGFRISSNIRCCAVPQKFPVKDPFQEMLKGSLQTFLNALTYRDKTVYPVASQVEKDFLQPGERLLRCGIPSAPFRKHFYQEGWHFDVADPSKAAGIKGIVYNEMKGVFSDFTSHVARRTLPPSCPIPPMPLKAAAIRSIFPTSPTKAFIAFYRRLLSSVKLHSFFSMEICRRKKRCVSWMKVTWTALPQQRHSPR